MLTVQALLLIRMVVMVEIQLMYLITLRNMEQLHTIIILIQVSIIQLTNVQKALIKNQTYFL